MSVNETADESVEHGRLVKALVEELKKQGFEILNAACEGYELCPEMETFVPDVKAYNGKKEFIVFGLAKTCIELGKAQTEEEFKYFSRRFMPKGKSKGKAVPFCIATTKGCENQLDACLKNLKLDKAKNIFKFAF